MSYFDELNNIWRDVQDVMHEELDLPRATIKFWFGKMNLISFRGVIATFSTDTSFQYEQVKNKYVHYLEDAFKISVGHPVEVVITYDDTLLDLYCGAGTIGLTMAKNAKQIIGVGRKRRKFSWVKNTPRSMILFLTKIKQVLVLLQERKFSDEFLKHGVIVLVWQELGKNWANFIGNYGKSFLNGGKYAKPQMQEIYDIMVNLYKVGNAFKYRIINDPDEEFKSGKYTTYSGDNLFSQMNDDLEQIWQQSVEKASAKWDEKNPNDAKGVQASRSTGAWRPGMWGTRGRF